MSRLLSQMEAVSHRFEELSIRLNQPETAADPALFRRLMQEYHEAEPVVQAYQALTTAQDHLAQAKALLEGEALDPDFKEMVQQEIGEKVRKWRSWKIISKFCCCPRMSTMIKASSWSCAAVRAAKRPRCLPTA